MTARRAPVRVRERSERGSATVWVLGAALLLSAAGALALAAGFVAIDRDRAASVADEAALAAADHARAGSAVSCRWAALVAAASSASVLDCSVAADGTARVVLSVALRGPLAGLPPATVRARAGPVPLR
jgi:secretion/DNA translocation related TadE-like protein